VQVTDSSRLSEDVIALYAAAAIGGVCCLVLPPYLVRGGVQHAAAGRSLMPWFGVAWANAQIAPTMLSSFFLGLAWGLASPRHWLGLALASSLAPPALLLIDISGDMERHNLFPFELFGCLVFSVPAVPGALLGYLARRRS
jgi:hypothetical protein